jgi:hypothetical protein
VHHVVVADQVKSRRDGDQLWSASITLPRVTDPG